MLRAIESALGFLLIDSSITRDQFRNRADLVEISIPTQRQLNQVIDVFFSPKGIQLPGASAGLLFFGLVTLPDGHPQFTTPQSSGIFDPSPGRIWLRTADDIFLIPYPDGRNRRFFNVPDVHDSPFSRDSQGFVGWGVPDTEEFSQRMFSTWISTPYSTDKYTAEVFDGILDQFGSPNDDGQGRIIPTKIAEYQMVSSRYLETVEPLTTLPAFPAVAVNTLWGGYYSIAISSTPYRVNPSTPGNEWLSVTGGGDIIAHDWNYDISGGTPVGEYDLRAVCQNFVGAVPVSYEPPRDPFGLFNPTIKYPHVEGEGDLYNSQMNPGAGGNAAPDVGCLRWVQRPTWNPSDPSSIRYDIRAYTYTLIPGIDPSDAPSQWGSAWTAITPPGIIIATKNPLQEVTYTPLGARYFHSSDSSNKGRMIVVFLKEIFGHQQTLLQFPCTFRTAKRNGAYEVQPGYLYQTDDYRAQAQGVAVYANGILEHNDLPRGFEGIERTLSSAFPSNYVKNRSTSRITSPSFTTTFRGFMRVNNDTPGEVPFFADNRLYEAATSRIRFFALPKIDGDFWVIVYDVLQGEAMPDLTQRCYVVSKTKQLQFPVPTTAGQQRLDLLVIQELGDRVYVMNIKDITGTGTGFFP